MVVLSVTFESGFIVVDDEASGKTRHSLTDILTAANVPDLNIASLTLLTTLANWVEIILRTLVDAKLISEELYITWDLETILNSLKDDLNTDIGDV